MNQTIEHTIHLIFFTVLLSLGLGSCEREDNHPESSESGGGVQPTTNVNWVDLGLPSGLLWADRNVGASSPEDYGDYFAWGETQPKQTYLWDTYAYGNGNYLLTKYCNNPSYGLNGFSDTLTVLQPMDDAATSNWGSGWRTPTETEWQELINNTESTWMSRNGVYGLLLTAPNSNSIFLPAAGGRLSNKLYNAGLTCYYWLSSLYLDNPSGARYFESASGLTLLLPNRSFGFSVRAVYSTR